MKSPRPTCRIIRIAWLPALLTLLLIAETFLFNEWLGIMPGSFEWRCAAATLALGMALFFPAMFFTKRSARYFYLSIISLPVAAIFITQSIYYRYSGGFLQASSLTYAKQTLDLLSTIKTLLSGELLFFALPLVTVTAGYFFADKNSKEDVSFTIKEKAGVFFIILVIVCSGYGTLLRLEQTDFGTVRGLYNDSDMYNLSSLVAKAGIVNFYLESLVEYALAPRIASPADTAFLTSWARGRTLPPRGADFGMLKGKNLIFIQVESLEDWIIGAQVNGVYIAPNLTALAGQGLYFSNYYSQDGVGNTADAEFSTLNSLYPLPDSVAFISHAENQYAALPQLLDDHGYTTAVMHGDVASFWNRANAYPPLGYENIVHAAAHGGPRGLGR